MEARNKLTSLFSLVLQINARYTVDFPEFPTGVGHFVRCLKATFKNEKSFSFYHLIKSTQTHF